MGWYSGAQWGGDVEGWIGPTALVNVLVPTSTFDGSTTTGWSSDGSLSASGGEFFITGAGGGYPQAGITKTGILTIGNWYRLVADGRYDASSGATSAINPTLDLTSGGSPSALQFLTSSTQTLSSDFQATGTDASVRLFCNAGTVPTGQKGVFANIKMYALP